MMVPYSLYNCSIGGGGGVDGGGAGGSGDGGDKNTLSSSKLRNTDPRVAISHECNSTGVQLV